MRSVGVSFLPYPIIAQKAEEFLSRYNPKRDIPVPVEQIIEFQLEVDIIPIPNLQRDFETDGFTSSDLKSIYVDEYILSERPARYRFTLAHELGHILLHRSIFESVRINSVESWKSFVEGIDDRERAWLEFQGYAFAGLFLVPPRALKRNLLEILPSLDPLIQKCRQRQIPRAQYLAYAKEELAAKLAPIFDVSVEVVIRRIEYDRLQKFIP